MSFFYTYDDQDKEKLAFLRLLYHDKKGGQMIRLRKAGEDVSQLSTCDLDALAATGTDLAHYYTTVNCFRGWKRTSDRVYNYCSIFIDLDCHGADADKIEDAKRRTVRLLEDAYTSGELATPTLITDSGRGFGIQYVLQKSIANIDKTAGQRKFYQKVRKGIFEKYKEILSKDPLAAQVDPAVLDDARVCRLPGTYNAAAGCYCRLICAAERYYELSDLVKGCHLWEWLSDKEYQAKREEREARQKATDAKVIPFDAFRLPFLQHRIEQLIKLQDIRGKACTDACREQLLFIAYSSLVQLDRFTAAEKLQELNLRFTDPLEPGELRHIIEETNANKRDGYSGFYKLTNEYIVQTLALTTEEIKAIGIGNGWKRNMERMEARKKKEEKRKKVVELLKQVDTLTYDDIAEAVGMSKRSICSIAKKEGLMRYRKALPCADDSGIAKSAKIATESVCAGSVSVSADALLSTLSARVTVADVRLCLQHYATESVIAQQLLRLYTGGRRRTALRPLIDDYFSLAVVTYDHLDSMALVKAQLHDLTLLARWFIDAAYGYVDFAKKTSCENETPEERELRMDGYLHRFRDQRFDIIEETEEYKIRLDPDVLKTVKIACMQVMRLKRAAMKIEGHDVPVKDIIQCFNSLTYKDIVILCERMAHQGTLQHAEKPFYYVMQTVWKYRHPEAAAAQADRLRNEKKGGKQKNSCCKYKQRDLSYELLEVNAMRRISGMRELSEEEFFCLRIKDKG